MGNSLTISQQVPDYELLLSGYFRHLKTLSIIPLTIVQICIQYCSNKHLCFLLLCTGSTDYNYQGYNEIQLCNLQNKKLYSLHIKDVNALDQIESLYHKKRLDGGMFTKCYAVSNLRLPQYITDIINSVTNDNKRSSYDILFRYARGQPSDFDMIAFDAKTCTSALYEENELKSNKIMAYRISLPSLPSTHIENKIIYNEFTDQLICVGGMYWYTSWDGRISNLEDSKACFTLDWSQYTSMNELTKEKWQQFGGLPETKNSLCVIGDKYKSYLMMLGSKRGSQQVYIYDLDGDYKTQQRDDEDVGISDLANKLSNMSNDRWYAGVCYEALSEKVFVGEDNVIEIYSIKKDKWKTLLRKTTNNFYNYPAMWTHPINPNLLFIAGDNEYIDFERTYLQHLGFCEWMDLRSVNGWKILNEQRLLEMFKFDKLSSIDNFPNIFNRSIVSMTK